MLMERDGFEERKRGRDVIWLWGVKARGLREVDSV
jgi:hypothetical protein